MQEQLFSWEALSAMGGASLLTFLVVQYTKVLVDRYASWLPTDLYAVLVAFIILTISGLALAQGSVDWRMYILALANSFLVAAAAGQLHDKVLNPPSAKEREDP